tara:strand:- start:1096 stop:1410 length:315 start_codon:yes stop_codon:yes gene_type:complete
MLVVQAGRLVKTFLFRHLFLNITKVFCAKKRVGHACICPRMVTGWPVLKLHPPKKELVFPQPKNENSPLKATVSDPKFSRFLFFRQKYCHAVLDSREHQGLPPD